MKPSRKAKEKGNGRYEYKQRKGEGANSRPALYQKYNGKTVVVKYGGNAMIHPLLKKAVMSDIILLKLVGINIVLVHGGGPRNQQHAGASGYPLQICEWSAVYG